MRKFTKILVAVLAIALLLPAVAACQEKAPEVSASPSGPAAPAAPDPVTITGWFYPRYVPPGLEPGVYEQQLIEEYTSIPGNEHVSINFELIQWDTGPEKVNVAIATGDAPDFTYDATGRIIGYGVNGALVPLNDLLPASVKNDIPQGIWAESSDPAGNIWMLPATMAVVGVGVNRALLREAGVEDMLPTNATRTMKSADFEAMCRALVDANLEGVLGAFSLYCLNEQGDAAIRNWIANQGETDFVNSSQTEIVLNSPGGIAGLQWLYDMYEDGLIVRNPETNNSLGMLEMFMQSQTPIATMFSTGNIAVLTNLILQGDADPDFDLWFMTLPTPTGTNPKVEVQVIGYCIFDSGNDARHKATFDFISWLAENTDAIASTNQFAVRNSINMASIDERYANPEWQYLAGLGEYVFDVGWSMANIALIRAEFFPQMQALFTGQKSVEQALNDFVAAANRTF